MKTVVIGGIAAGAKVASRLKRLSPQSEVIVIEKGCYLSYVQNALSLVVGNVVRDANAIMQTTWQAVRTAEWMEQVKGFKTFLHHEVVSIDPMKKTIEIKNAHNAATISLSYDNLVWADGVQTIRPSWAKDSNVITLDRMEDALQLQDILKQGIERALLVNPRMQELSMIEALANWGIDVAIVTENEALLSDDLEEDMNILLQYYLENTEDITCYTNASIHSLITEDDSIKGLETNQGAIEGDLILLGGERAPDTCVLEKAGIEIQNNGIVVDCFGKTNIDSIYATGVGTLLWDKVTCDKRMIDNPNIDNRHAYIVAENLFAADSRPFTGVVHNRLVKVFDWYVGSVGLTEKEAKARGFSPISALYGSPDAEPFVPAKKKFFLRVIADKNTNQVLGAQGVGPGRLDKRIDVIATALLTSEHLTLDILEDLDLGYEPMVARAMDNTMTAAHLTHNIVRGLAHAMPYTEAIQHFDKEDTLFIDIRTPIEIEKETVMPAQNKVEIPLETLKSGAFSLPKDKKLVVFCTLSTRGLEAQQALEQAGYEASYLEGGLEFWPLEF